MGFTIQTNHLINRGCPINNNNDWNTSSSSPPFDSLFSIHSLFLPFHPLFPFPFESFSPLLIQGILFMTTFLLVTLPLRFLSFYWLLDSPLFSLSCHSSWFEVAEKRTNKLYFILLLMQAYSTFESRSIASGGKAREVREVKIVGKQSEMSPWQWKIEKRTELLKKRDQETLTYSCSKPILTKPSFDFSLPLILSGFQDARQNGQVGSLVVFWATHKSKLKWIWF